MTGHVREVARQRGPQFYIAYRDASGKQHQKRLGPKWTRGGRPPEGFFTKRMAQDALEERLVELRRDGGLPASRVGATFADASAAWLREAERERDCKHSTLTDYRLMVRRLDAAFGDQPLVELTAAGVEAWVAVLLEDRSNRTAQKYLTALSGILALAEHRWNVPNVAAKVRRPRVRSNGRIDFFSPEEVWSLVRAAGSEQDAAIFLTAAFTGLRMGELLALRWRCVDFARRSVRVERGFTLGREDTPKSNRERVVPLAQEVAEALARIGQRDEYSSDEDLVFCGALGGHLSPSKLRTRYGSALDAAGLRRLRFHDLRHTFGSIAINRASAVQVKTWMGHADLKTTERYLHFKEQGDEADLLADAFARGPAGVRPGRTTAPTAM